MEELDNGIFHSSLSKSKMKSRAVNLKIAELNQLIKFEKFSSVLTSDGKLIIYTVHLENRYSVYSELLSFLNIEDPCTKKVIFNDSTLNESNVCEFQVNVTDIWPSMIPETVIHKFKDKDRSVRKLRKHIWTHVVYDEIQKMTNVPCAFSFKKCQISESFASIFFASIFASCSECHSEFIGQILDEPREGNIIMLECTIQNFDRSS